MTSSVNNFPSGVPLSTENWKTEGLLIFEIIKMDQWNLVLLTFLAQGIQKSWSFLKLTMSSSIIHSEWHIVTLGHFGVKQGQIKLKFGMLANFRSRNSNFTFGFQIDPIFINYSCKIWNIATIVNLKEECNNWWIIDEDMVNSRNECHIWIPRSKISQHTKF